MDFKVGDKFSSLAELELAIANYSKRNYVDLHKRDARTLQAAVKEKKLSEDRLKNKELKYYQIKYVCIFGGRDNFKTRGEGSRKTKTFQRGCPFFIQLQLSEDGNHLVVTKIDNAHKFHDIDDKEYSYLPKVRKLTEDDRAHVSELMAIGANKKIIQQQMSSTTGKRITLKDLSNIENRYKNSHHSTKNDISTCVEQLRQKYNCTVDVCIDTEENFCGLFVQDVQMREKFSAYHEILFLDATYKLLELEFPVYLFVVEDANGEAEIVGMGALVHEDAESLGWLIKSFMNRNPNVDKTRLVMADKDLNERDMLKELLPWATVLICLFHALKTFRREITLETMKITSQMKEICLQLIQKMCYAKSHAEYEGIYTQFCNVAPASVRTYFDSNWHPIREEWVAGFKQVSGNFMNSTNNRLESINGKLKQVIKKHSTLEFFIEHFFILLPVIRNQRTYNTVYQGQKRPVKPYEANSPEALYMSLLTSYAFSFVLNQLQLVSTTTYHFTPDVTQQGSYCTQTSDGNIKVTSLKCTCCFSQSMLLPCRHIFHVRKNLGISLYDKSLCANRWTNTYSRAQLKSATPSESENVSPEVSVSLQTHVKKWSTQQKFSRAIEVCRKIANVVALSSQTNFEHRLTQLNSLHEAWGKGSEIGLQILEHHSTSADSGSDINCDNICLQSLDRLAEEVDVIPTGNDTTINPANLTIENLSQSSPLQLPPRVDDISVDSNNAKSTVHNIISQIPSHETETDSLCAIGSSIAGASIMTSGQSTCDTAISFTQSLSVSSETCPISVFDNLSSSLQFSQFGHSTSSFIDTAGPSTGRELSRFSYALLDSSAKETTADAPHGYFMSSLLDSPSHPTSSALLSPSFTLMNSSIGNSTANAPLNACTSPSLVTSSMGQSISTAPLSPSITLMTTSIGPFTANAPLNTCTSPSLVTSSMGQSISTAPLSPSITLMTTSIGPSTTYAPLNTSPAFMDSSMGQPTSPAPANPSHALMTSSMGQSTLHVASFASDDYDDDLSNFNLNFTRHNPDREVIELVLELVGEVVTEEEAQRLLTSPNIFEHDQQVTISTLKRVKMPPPVKVVGRPKGSSQTTVIGTRKVSKKKSCCMKFTEMRESDKEKFLLSLCIGAAATDLFLKQGDKIQVQDIDPTEIKTALFHPAVCLESIRYMFTDDAWERFQYYFSSKSAHLKFACSSCRKLDKDGADLISCEHCLKSFHFLCVKLKKNVKRRQEWFCAACRAQEKLEAERSTEELN